MKEIYEAGEGVKHRSCNSHKDLVIIVYDDREEVEGFCMQCNTKVSSEDIMINDEVFNMMKDSLNPTEH